MYDPLVITKPQHILRHFNVISVACTSADTHICRDHLYQSEANWWIQIYLDIQAMHCAYNSLQRKGVLRENLFLKTILVNFPVHSLQSLRDDLQRSQDHKNPKISFLILLTYDHKDYITQLHQSGPTN